jgi:hypothetical protein
MNPTQLAEDPTHFIKHKKIPPRPTMMTRGYREKQALWDAKYGKKVTVNDLVEAADRISESLNDLLTIYKPKKVEEEWKPIVQGVDHLLTMPLSDDDTWDGFGYNPYCQDCHLLSVNPFAFEQTCLECFLKG